MKLIYFKFLVDDLVRAQDENVYHKGQYLAEIDLDDWEEDLDSREDGTGVREIREMQMKDMRMQYQREAGYLEALKFVQEELKKLISKHTHDHTSFYKKSCNSNFIYLHKR